MARTTYYEAVRNYEGRRTDTERAFDVDKAKALIRNHVSLNGPAEWIDMNRLDKEGYVLSNAPKDVEVEIYERTIHGEPPQEYK